MTQVETKEQLEVELVLTSGLERHLTEYLRSSPLESISFVWGKLACKKGTIKGLATDVAIPSDDDYERRSWGNVKISREFVNKEFEKREKQGLTLLATVHSQPMIEPSHGDVETHLKVTQFYPHQLTGTYSAGQLSFFRHNPTFGMELVQCRVVEIGRYDRQVLAWGEESQLLISSSCIALVGAGGGGAKMASDLAAMGVPKLKICDPDVWEEHNRTRALIPPWHVGMNKSKSLRLLLEEFYPSVQIDDYDTRAEDLDEEVFADCDLLVIGPDNFLTRIYGNRLALRLRKPAIFPAAGIKVENGKITAMGGSCRVYLPERPSWPCYECQPRLRGLERKRETYTEAEKSAAKEKYGVDLADVTVPSLASLNNVVAGFALWEIEKILTGIDEPYIFQFYDALTGEAGTITQERNLRCPACGTPRSPQELDELEQSLREKLEQNQNEAPQQQPDTRLTKASRWIKKKIAGSDHT